MKKLRSAVALVLAVGLWSEVSGQFPSDVIISTCEEIGSMRAALNDEGARRILTPVIASQAAWQIYTKPVNDKTTTTPSYAHTFRFAAPKGLSAKVYEVTILTEALGEGRFRVTGHRARFVNRGPPDVSDGVDGPFFKGVVELEILRQALSDHDVTKALSNALERQTFVCVHIRRHILGQGKNEDRVYMVDFAGLTRDEKNATWSSLKFRALFDVAAERVTKFSAI